MEDAESQMHEALKERVRKYFGLVVTPHQEENYRQAIHQVCEKFNLSSPLSLLQKLDNAELDSKEIESLVSIITNGESYFFRDEHQFELFRSRLLPELIVKKRAKQDYSLKIWSAGCSSGQELYSIAMMIQEMLLDPAQWKISLIGTDINTEFIGLAIKGEYSDWSFRNETGEKYKCYFTKSGQIYTLNKPIRDRVNFSYLNLVDNQYPSIANGIHAVDVIFCRNVFIYFDGKTISAILKKLYDCFSGGGYLLVGPSDLINYDIEKNLFRYYALDANTEATNILRPIPREQAEACATPIVALLHEKKWEEVIHRLEDGASGEEDSARTLQWKAKAYANLGHSKEAIQFCEESLRQDPLDVHSHLLMAQIRMEMDALSDAEQSLKKCLYLEPNMVEAHYTLGLFKLRIGKFAEAIRHLQNALDLANKMDPHRKVHNMPDLTFGELAKTLDREIEIYQQMLEAR